MVNKLIDLTQKQIIRNEILEILENVGETGASDKVIIGALANQGYKLEKEAVERELAYLKGKELIKTTHVENKRLNISRDVYYITSNGMDVLDGTENVSGLQAGD